MYCARKTLFIPEVKFGKVTDRSIINEKVFRGKNIKGVLITKPEDEGVYELETTDEKSVHQHATVFESELELRSNMQETVDNIYKSGMSSVLQTDQSPSVSVDCLRDGKLTILERISV